MPELKIAFCVHQNARQYYGSLSSIQVTGTEMVFIFENMIIYDVLSALQFLLSLSSGSYSCCFSPISLALFLSCLDPLAYLLFHIISLPLFSIYFLPPSILPPRNMNKKK